jgi:hypothetical protein
MFARCQISIVNVTIFCPPICLNDICPPIAPLQMRKVIQHASQQIETDCVIMEHEVHVLGRNGPSEYETAR